MGFPSTCGMYNDDDFTATAMCCACGAGSSTAYPTLSHAPTASPRPSPSPTTSPHPTVTTVDGILCGSDTAVWNPRVEEGYATAANLWIPNTVPDRNTSLQIDGAIGAEHVGHAVTTAVVGDGSTVSMP